MFISHVHNSLKGDNASKSKSTAADHYLRPLLFSFFSHLLQFAVKMFLLTVLSHCEQFL